MATPAEFVVYNTVNDTAQLVSALLGGGADKNRIYQRYLGAGGEASLAGFVWPAGYTQADFVSLMAVLNALPQMLITDSGRNALFKLLASFQ